MLCPSCHCSGIEITTLGDSIRHYLCTNPDCVICGIYDGDPVLPINIPEAIYLEKQNELAGRALQPTARAEGIPEAIYLEKQNEILVKTWAVLNL